MQREELKANQEATEAIKKAKVEEIATLEQEHINKYNDLQNEKLSSENALRQQAELEKNEAVMMAR